MNASERRTELLRIIKQAQEPVSGSELAKRLKVSRQVIVTDIALLKAAGNDIASTNKGYIIHSGSNISRVFKVVHTDDEIETELNSIVDMGATVKDVFVWHKIYGKIVAELNVSSRRNVKQYLNNLKTGRSSPLKNVTSEYHYHTVIADSEETLDLVKDTLIQHGFLVSDEETA